MLQTEILGKYNSSLQWSKLPNLQMHRKLGFIWKTYAQPAIGVIGIPRCPRGCAQRKALESQLFLVQFKDAFISTFQRPDLHQRKYQFLEEKHSLLGSLPQLSAWGTLYNNSVYGNWLRRKGIAKVSGIYWRVAILILKVYMKGWQKDPKRRIKKQNAEKISWFFNYSYSLNKRGTGHS